MRFGYVPAPYGRLGPAIAALLDGAVKRGKNDWREVWDSLATGKAQLWLTVTDKPIAAMVTRMDGDTFEVWLAGGKVLSGSVPFLETAIEAAKASGATNARLEGRKGWSRGLRPYGWHEQGEMLVKEFE